MFELVRAYWRGMKEVGPCSWGIVSDEWKELLRDRNVEEMWDVMHAFCRWTRVPGLALLAWPTVVKHARRYMEYGSVRSKRHL